MKAIWNNRVIADSDSTVVIEGNHYFPADTVDKSVLRDSKTATICPWKGTASYYSIEVDGQKNPDAAWYYAEPKAACGEIKSRIAFWKGVQISE